MHASRGDHDVDRVAAQLMAELALVAIAQLREVQEEHARYVRSVMASIIVDS